MNLEETISIGIGGVEARLVVGVEHDLDRGGCGFSECLGREGRPLDSEPVKGLVGGFGPVRDREKGLGWGWRGWERLGLGLSPLIHGRASGFAEPIPFLGFPKVLESICGDGREGAHVLPEGTEVFHQALDAGGLGGTRRGWKDHGIAGEGL